MNHKDYTWEQIQDIQELFPFECGYGTGEEHTIPLVYKFMELLEDGRLYNFEVMEEVLGKVVAWVLIELLSNCDLIEWGTSSRFGWLTTRGEELRDMVGKFTQAEMYYLVTAIPNDYI